MTMVLNFISNERMFTNIVGTGVQYIPGHSDSFVDYILTNNLPNRGKILELGGGGLRFGLPASMSNIVTVVDLDAASMDIKKIQKKVKANGKWSYDTDKIRQNLTTTVYNAKNYLTDHREQFSLIAAFRLLHFFDAAEIEDIFLKARNSLDGGGIFAFSGFSKFELPRCEVANSLFSNSTPVNGNRYYRQYKENKIINDIRAAQNIGKYSHFFDIEYVQKLSKKYHFEILLGGYPSTKIVEGYVLRAC